MIFWKLMLTEAAEAGMVKVTLEAVVLDSLPAVADQLCS